MANPLIWLSGAQPELLRRCRTDKPKYLGIGSAIAITAGVASTSMTFALTTALRAPLVVALPFALLWGLAIMSLDRWLVVSLERQAGVLGLARYLLLASVRMGLALLIGFIVSTPFVLEIFHPEIDNEIAIIHARLSDQFQRHPPLQAAVNTDQAQVSHFEGLVKTGGTVPDPYKNPAVAGLVSQRTADQQAVTHWYGVYNCQLYGKSYQGLKCVAGNGPAAAKALAHLQYYQGQVRGLTQKITTQVNQIDRQAANGNAKTVSNAEKSLTEWQTKLTKDQNEQRALVARFNTTNSANGGLLIRLQALSDLTNHNSTLTWARWLLFALFTVIECLPILVKTLLNLGAPTAYEKVHADEEQMWLEVSRDATARKEQAGRIEADGILAEAQRLADKRQPMIEEVTARAVEAEQNVAMAWIDTWESRQLREVGQSGLGQSGLGHSVPTGATLKFRTRSRPRGRWDGQLSDELP